MTRSRGKKGPNKAQPSGSKRSGVYLMYDYTAHPLFSAMVLVTESVGGDLYAPGAMCFMRQGRAQTGTHRRDLEVA